jgi:hypothetical protein
MTARKRTASQAVSANPDRPLLRLLNRAGKKPVLAMCGLPGNHDPAHAAAGRLPVRFHRFSDVRLYWREFQGGYYRPDQQQRFMALILLSNAGKPIVDLLSASTIMDFRDSGKPVLWGEASPEGAVLWRPEFDIASVEVGREFYIKRTEIGPGVVYEGHYQWVCGSHYQLVPEPA